MIFWKCTLILQEKSYDFHKNCHSGPCHKHRRTNWRHQRRFRHCGMGSRSIRWCLKRKIYVCFKKKPISFYWKNIIIKNLSCHVHIFNNLVLFNKKFALRKTHDILKPKWYSSFVYYAKIAISSGFVRTVLKIH